MLNLLDNVKLKTSAVFAAAVLFVGCFQDPMSVTNPRPTEGDVHVKLRMAVESVSKLGKGNAISLQRMIVVFTSNGSPVETITDTLVAGSTPGFSTSTNLQQTVNKNYTLKSLRSWKIVATVRDARDSVIYRDSASTPPLYSADTAVVNLNLTSRYAMYAAKFLSIPDSISSATGSVKQKLTLNRLVLWVDGVKVRDSSGTFTSGSSPVLEYDYVGTSSKALVSSGTTNHLTSVDMVNADTGYAVGFGGTALRTIDGGASWSPMAGTGVKALRSVFFINAKVGWIAGDSVLLRTTNGGGTWTPQTTPAPAGFTSLVKTVTFSTANNGVALSANTVGSSLSAYRTVDGGANWTITMAVPSTYGAAFASASQGWAVGVHGAGSPFSSNIRMTSDSGKTWNVQASPTTKTLRALHVVNSNLVFAVGDSVILRTTNGGTNWASLTSGVPLRNFKSVHFIDASTGFVVGENGLILTTVDGGDSWVQEASPSTKQLNGVHFFGGKGFVVGNDGTLFSFAGPRLVEMIAYGPMGNWNVANPLFYGSKYIHSVPGESPTIPLTLNWVGPTSGTGSISATLGRVGKVTIVGTLPGTVP